MVSLLGKDEHSDNKLIHSLTGANKSTPENDLIIKVLTQKPKSVPDDKKGEST